jgi:type I restriction enzyme S subunit
MNDWKIVKLKTLLSISIKNGYSPVCPEHGNGKWVLGLGALTGQGLDLTQKKPAPEGDPQTENFLLKPGDFLVSRSNTLDKVGRAGLFQGEPATYVYPDLMMRFRVRETVVHPGFLEQWLRSKLAVRYFQRSACGTSGSMVKINKGILENLPVVLPPLETQRTLSTILSTWDSTIDMTERLIEAKRLLHQALSQKLLFGRLRLRRRKTNMVNRKHYFSVPTDWRIAKIDSIATEVTNRNQNGEVFPVLSCTKHQGLVDSLRFFDKQVFSNDTTAYKVVRYGQFAYATNHIEEGSIGYQNLHSNALVSPMYTVFEIDPKQVDGGFLYKLLKTEIFRHIFEVNTNASVDRRGSLRWKSFGKLPLPLPNVEEQEEISATLDLSLGELNLLGTKLELLKKQRAGLMQKLLTGKWRVMSAREVI